MEEKTTYTTMEIRFRDLSTPLKMAVIAAWIIGSTYVLAFIIGFFIGLLS